ncbi:LEPR-XLL domain-containing protein, partial [Streptomyces sp. NPDC127103]
RPRLLLAADAAVATTDEPSDEQPVE